MNISFHFKEEIHVEEKREVYKKDAERLFSSRCVPTGKETAIFYWKKVDLD